jgi:hypothetical protein
MSERIVRTFVSRSASRPGASIHQPVTAITAAAA